MRVKIIIGNLAGAWCCLKLVLEEWSFEDIVEVDSLFHPLRQRLLNSVVDLIQVHIIDADELCIRQNQRLEEVVACLHLAVFADVYCAVYSIHRQVESRVTSAWYVLDWLRRWIYCITKQAKASVYTPAVVHESDAEFDGVNSQHIIAVGRHDID